MKQMLEEMLTCVTTSDYAPTIAELIADEVEEDVDANLKEVVTGTVKNVEAKMAELRVADAITEVFNLFKRCNKFIFVVCFRIIMNQVINRIQ